MKIKLICIWIVFFIFGFISESAAKYYQYIDQNGNMSFTDNVSEIPKDQLNQIQSFESARPDKTLLKKNKQNRKQPKSKIKANLKTWDGHLRFTAESLEREQEKLERTNLNLQREKTKLQKISINNLKPNQKKSYNKSIKELNNKIQQYHKQCGILKSKINKFHEKLK